MMAARGVWLLPDDGIVDDIAVEIAVKGIRPVRLTAQERRMAAALILARGGSACDIAARLCMSWSAACALAVSVSAADTGPVLDGAA